MKYIAGVLSVLATLLLASCATHKPTPSANLVEKRDAQFTAQIASARTIRVGFWNIEHLGGDITEPRSAGSEKPKVPPERSANTLADYIQASGVAVLGLCEIYVTGLPDRNTYLDATVIELNRQTRGDWKYRLVSATKNDVWQNTGVLWNNSIVQLKGEPIKADVATRLADNRRIHDRHPFLFFFSAGIGKTDFVLVPLHLKANTSSDAIERRNAESETIVSAVPEITQRYGESDLIFLGDFNSLSNNEQCHNYFLSADFRDLHVAGTPTYVSQDYKKYGRGEKYPEGKKPINPKQGAEFDHVFVPTGSGSAEFTQSKGTVFSTPYLSERGIDEIKFLRGYSDHYMVYFDLKVMKDDDAL